MTKHILVGAALVVPFLAGGCGGSTPVAPSVPATAIEGRGAGIIQVGPSAVPTHSVAIVFPIDIRETGGGTATWNFMRVSYLRAGLELERAERGSDEIRAAGFADIAARADITVRVTTRTNVPNWDTAIITLGFSDKRDGRQFTTGVPFNTFSGVELTIVPQSVPGDFRIELVR